MRLISVTFALFLLSLSVPALAGPSWIPGPFDNGTAPQGADGRVWCTTSWDPDGPNGPLPATTVIGGNFTSVTGVSARHVAMLDPVTRRWVPIGEGLVNTCTALTVYNGYLIAGVQGAPGVMMWANGHWGQFGDGVLGNAVYALTTFNGDLFVGGQFTATKNGQVLATNLARYDEINNRWDPTNDTGPGADPVQTVRCLVSWNGTLFAGTEYSPSPGVFAGDVWEYQRPQNNWLDRVQTNGAVMAFQPYNGELVATGAFTIVGTSSIPTVMAWDTYSWHSIGSNPPSGVGLGLTVWNSRLIVLGAFVTNSVPVLGAALNGSTWQSIGSGFDGSGYCGIGEPNDLLVGGDFTHNPANAPFSHLARWDGNAWYPVGAGTVSNVLAMAHYGGRLVLGGTFHQSTLGDPEANNIVAWDGDRFTSYGAGVDDQVNALCSYTFGSHINQTNELVAGGYFLHADGVAANGIARWDQGLTVIGNPVWKPMGNGFDSAVQAIERCTLNGTANTYAAGWFSWSGSTFLGHIGRWNPSSGPSGAWESMGGGTDGPIYALKYFNGYLYAGGAFSHAGTALTGGLARWDGTSWSACGGFFNGTIYALEVFNGALAIGGSFPGTNNSPNLAAYNGSTYFTFGTGGTSGTVTALHAMGTKLYVGGVFETTGGFPVRNVALWDGAWHDVYAGTDGTVYCLNEQGSEIDAGGLFTHAGPTASSSPCMARYTDTGIPCLLSRPFSQTVNAGATTAFSAVVASGYGSLTTQWLLGNTVVANGPTGIGSTIAGAGGTYLTIANTEPGDGGDYRFVVANANGADTSGAATLTVANSVAVGGQPAVDRTLFEAIGPNPSRGAGTLFFTLARSAHVRFGVFDLAGRRVAALDLGMLAAGRHGSPLDLATRGQRPDAGVYFVTMAVDGRSAGTLRMALVR
jgi:hypothetical protein